MGCRVLAACVALVLILEGGSEPASAASRGGDQAQYIAVVEFNTFGSAGNERTAVIFRESDGRIRDWRWEQEHHKPLWGRMGWLEDGHAIDVIVGRVVRTRTEHDQELYERQFWPESRRRKLR